MSLFLFGRDIVVAVMDLFTGNDRRRYEHSVAIHAPRQVVWDMLRARDIRFDGRFPLRVVVGPVEGQPDVERVRIQSGTIELTMVTRIVDQRPGQAILYELLARGTDRPLVEGHDDYIGFVLVETDYGTRLDLTREMTPRRGFSRLTVPMGLRSGARRYKRKAEAMAREQRSSQQEAESSADPRT